MLIGHIRAHLRGLQGTIYNITDPSVPILCRKRNSKTLVCREIMQQDEDN